MLKLILEILSVSANNLEFKPNEKLVFDYFIYMLLGKTENDKLLENDLDKILDQEPTISIYALNNLLDRIEKQENKNIVLKKDTGLKLISCLKLDRKSGSYDAVINLLDFILCWVLHV